MRKHLSILALWVRSTFWGAAAVLAVTAAAQLGLLWRQLGAVQAGEISRFAELVGRSRINLVYAVGLTVLWVWLLYVGCAAKRNTLGRLSVGETGVTLWHAACCVGWLVVFRAVQVGVVLAGYRMYLGVADPALVSGQTLYLACWQDGLLHWLLPLRDRWTAAGVVLCTLALGQDAAVDGSSKRRGRRFSVFRSHLPWAILTLGPVFGGIIMPWGLMLVLAVVDLMSIHRLYRSRKEEQP